MRAASSSRGCASVGYILHHIPHIPCMFTEPTINQTSFGFSGYIWVDTILVFEMVDFNENLDFTPRSSLYCGFMTKERNYLANQSIIIACTSSMQCMVVQFVSRS